ncbi:MAG: Wzz/FepE/Etk N-terminal domain-containing protein [bacterium]
MDINNLNKSRYIRNFGKDKKLIVIITIIILIWSLIYLMIFYKPSYKSIAKIWIKDLTGQEFVTSLGHQNPLASLNSAQNPLLTQIEILKSNQLQDFVYNYRLKKKSKTKPLNSDDLIDVKNKEGTDILSITLTCNDPKEAQDLLNASLKEYDNINLLINRKIRTTRRKYIDLKLDEIEKKLYETRNKIKLFKSANLAISIDEESIKLVDQKIATSSKLEDVTADINNTASSIVELENKLSLKAGEALDAVALGSGNQSLIKLREDLNTSIQQYEFDSSKLAETNPKMIAQKNKIAAINSQIKDQIKLSLGKYAKNKGINIFDSVREQLVENLITAQTKLIGLHSEKNSINNSITKINSEQSKMPEKMFTLDNLQQEERTLGRAYDELREKQIEARIKEAEAVSNIIVIDSSTLPEGASFPSRNHVLIISLLLGIISGFSISILKTLLEDVCDDVEEIEQITETSTIGTIPWLKYHILSEPSEFIHKIAYNNIVSNLMIKCYKNNNKVLVFTSSSLKKPQSSVLYYLACRLKKLGHSVAVIDSDFRIPTLLKDAAIEHKVKTNLSDLILSLETKFRTTKTVDAQEVLNALVEDEKGIKHLGNKEMVFEPYEFFGTSSFESLVGILKAEFDWVLIDTGAAHITPEFLIISRLSDGVILFVNKTITYTILKNITKTLKNAGIPIIGTIVRESESKLENEYKKYLRYQEDRTIID